MSYGARALGERVEIDMPTPEQKLQMLKMMGEVPDNAVLPETIEQQAPQNQSRLAKSFVPRDNDEETLEDLPPVYVPEEEVELQAAPEQEPEVVEEEVAPIKNPVKSASSKAKEENLRIMRERAERAEREREMLMAELMKRAHPSEVAPRKAPVVEEDVDFDINIADDDLADGKVVKALATQVKRLSKELVQAKQQTQATTLETRLKQTYPDYQEVLSDDNIAALKTMEPEIFAGVESMNDKYLAVAAAYKWVKKLGIHEDSGSLTDKRQSIARNTAKPKPTQSLGIQKSSPLTDAARYADKRMTESDRLNEWRIMQEIRRRS